MPARTCGRRRQRLPSQQPRALLATCTVGGPSCSGGCAAPPHTTSWGAYRQHQQVLGRGPRPASAGAAASILLTAPAAAPHGRVSRARQCAAGRLCSRVHTRRACPVPRTSACHCVTPADPGPRPVAAAQYTGAERFCLELWKATRGRDPWVQVPALCFPSE